MIKNNQLKLLLIATVSLLLSGFLFWQGLGTNEISPGQLETKNITKAGPEGRMQAKVIRVVDGDTIEVDIQGALFKLRYTGINTPETVDPRRPVQCFGKQASQENKSLVEGKTVLLENDVSDTDKYGRLLRYVYLPLTSGSTLFVNDYLVRQGYATVDTFPPDVKYSKQFLEAQIEAREKKLGLWAKCY